MNLRIRTIRTISAMALALSLLPSVVFAETWVIGPGHEEEILALVEPYDFGDAVQADWTLGPIAIEGAEVSFELNGPGGETAVLRAVHPSVGTTRLKSRTFAYELEAPSDAGQAAARALAQTMQRNDDGVDLWKMTLSAEREGAVPTAPRRNIAGLVAAFALLFAASFALPWALRRRRVAAKEAAAKEAAANDTAASEQVPGGAQDVDVADDADEIPGGGVDDGERTDSL